MVRRRYFFGAEISYKYECHLVVLVHGESEGFAEVFLEYIPKPTGETYLEDDTLLLSSSAHISASARAHHCRPSVHRRSKALTRLNPTVLASSNSVMLL